MVPIGALAHSQGHAGKVSTLMLLPSPLQGLGNGPRGACIHATQGEGLPLLGGRYHLYGIHTFLRGVCVRCPMIEEAQLEVGVESIWFGETQGVHKGQPEHLLSGPVPGPGHQVAYGQYLVLLLTLDARKDVGEAFLAPQGPTGSIDCVKLLDGDGFVEYGTVGIGMSPNAAGAGQQDPLGALLMLAQVGLLEGRAVMHIDGRTYKGEVDAFS